MYQPRKAELPKVQQADLILGNTIGQREASSSTCQQIGPTTGIQKRTGSSLRNAVLVAAIVLVCLVVGSIWFIGAAGSQPARADEVGSHPSTPQAEWRKGAVPALYQFDPQWSEYAYANAKFSETGCGPISLAMAYIALTGDTSVSPIDVADLATKGGFASADGTDWLFMIAGAEELGLGSEQFVLSEELLHEYLSQGLPVVCIMGPGDFTSTGHFIVITGVNSDGTYAVCDSNSIERTKQPWSFETLYSQHLNAWVLWQK